MKLTDPITIEQINEVKEYLALNSITGLVKRYSELYGMNENTIKTRINSIKQNRKQKPQNFFPILHFIRTGEKLEFETINHNKDKNEGNSNN